MAHYKALGYPEVFSDISPRGVRVVYVDTSSDLPGMLEIIEMTGHVEEQYRTMQRAVQEWDGTSFVVHKLQPKRPGASRLKLKPLRQRPRPNRRVHRARPIMLGWLPVKRKNYASKRKTRRPKCASACSSN